MENPTANIILNSEWLKPFLLRSRTRMPTFITTILHYTGSLSQSNQSWKRKGIQFGKEEVKLSLFTGDVIPYVQNSKKSTKTLVLINSATFHSISMQKFICLFLHIQLKSKLRRQFICSGIQKNKISVNKFNQGERLVRWKLQQCCCTKWKDICAIMGWKVILLKWLYYPKQSIGSLWSLSKFQQPFL